MLTPDARVRKEFCLFSHTMQLKLCLRGSRDCRAKIWTPNVCLIDFTVAHVRRKRVKSSAFSADDNVKVEARELPRSALQLTNSYRAVCYQKSFDENEQELRFSVQTLFS